MVILHDSAWQFIVNTSITVTSCVVTSIITIWLARRIPVELTMSYETLNIEEIQGEENIKAIKAKMQMLLEDKTSDSLCLFTFKVWNDGQKPIWLSDSTPLIVRFKQGVKILGWGNLECEPDYIKVIPTIEEGEVRLNSPFLNSKNSITMHLLLNGYVDGFPDVYSEVHHTGKTNFARANNIRSSRENKIAGIVAICIGILSLISYYYSYKVSMINLSTVPLVLLFYVVIGIGFLYFSHIEKSSLPHNKLLSRMIKDRIREFLTVLPHVGLIVGIGIAIYSFFGREVFMNSMFTFIMFLLPAILWVFMYYILKWIFERLKINCKSTLLVILAFILPTLMLIREIPLIVFAWTHP